jgi:hypothetical protein
MGGNTWDQVGCALPRYSGTVTVLGICLKNPFAPADDESQDSMESEALCSTERSRHNEADGRDHLQSEERECRSRASTTYARPRSRGQGQEPGSAGVRLLTLPLEMI